jgi:aminomethyltransferase
MSSGAGEAGKRTPLYADHARLGARFVPFGGWDMPVQYSGILAEHAAVRTAAGLFDVSHMGEVELRGPGALAAAQEMTANDVARLADGQAQYSLLLLPDGGIVDDIMVYRLGAERILLCINAANVDKDVAWIRAHAGTAEVVDRSAETGLLALQGPKATGVLARLTATDVAALPRFACAEVEIAGRRVLAARTGYTGEDGWELFVANADASPLWNALLEAGAADGLVPVGLGARDTLRLEAALPLYGNDLDETTTPLEARLGWVVHFDKPSFVGRDALLAQREAGVQRRLCGFTIAERGIARPGQAILVDGREVGRVTSGTHSPTLGKAIGLGYVPPDCAHAGAELGIDIRGRTTRATVTPLPFYRRKQAGGS